MAGPLDADGYALFELPAPLEWACVEAGISGGRPISWESALPSNVAY